MRKKFTALCMLLLSLVGLTANAQTFTWGLEEGATVTSFSEVTLTVSDIQHYFDGNYASTGECGLFKADGTMVSSFGWDWCPYTLVIENGTVSFTLQVQSDQVFPDYPVSTAGDYYLRIVPGFFRWSPDGSENYVVNEEMRLNFKIEPVPGYVSEADVTVDPAAGVLKSCPEQWTVSINKEDIVKTELTADARIEFYANSWTYYTMIPEISEDGKTITLAPGADSYGENLTDKFASLNPGTYRLIIYKGSLKFNDDDTKTNDLIQVYYTIPETCRYNTSKTFPIPSGEKYVSGEGYVWVDSKITSLSNFELYFYEMGATIEVPAENEDLSNVCRVDFYTYDPETDSNSWAPIAYYDTELIPAVKDEYGYWTYPGVKLSLKEEYANKIFPEGKYRLVAPSGAYIATTLQTDWEDSQVLETVQYEADYVLAENPGVSTAPVWGFEDGAVFTSFAETTATFAGLTNVALVDKYDTSKSPELLRVNPDGSETLLGYLSAGYYDESTWSDIVEPDENGAIRLYMRQESFDPYYPLDIDGDYKINMKRGFLQLEGFSDLVNDASVITFKISTTTLLKQVNTSIDPAPSEITAYPEKLVVTFDNEDIQSLEVNMIEEKYWDYDENGNWSELSRTVEAKADIIMAYDNYSWACGQYLMQINPENPKQVILTPDPASIPEDAMLQYGNYKFRIPRGGLTANKGTETECTNSILEWGLYSYVQRFKSSVVLPLQDEVQSELQTFYVKFTDQTGYEAWGTPSIGEGVAQLMVLDEVKNEWVLYSDLTTTIDSSTGVNNYIFSLYYPVTTSGRYKVVIPRNTVVFEDWGSQIGTEACEAEFVVESDEEYYTIATDPAQGDVPFIDDIKLTFQDSWMTGAYIYAWPYEKGAVAFNAQGEAVAYANMSTEYNADWSMYHLIDFEPAITEVGEYRVVVGYNVIDTDYNGVGDNVGFDMTFNVVGGDPVLTVSPADGETLTNFKDFSFSWVGCKEVTIDETKVAKLYTVAEGGEKELYSDLTCTKVNNKNVLLSISDFSKPLNNGAYAVEVPAGIFSVDGTANEAMTLNYTLAAAVLNVTEVETPLAKLLLTAEFCKEIKVNDECKDPIALYRGETLVGTYTVENVDGVTCDLILSEGAEVIDGDYTVVIPATYFWVDNDMCREFRIAFNGYTSIESIADDANFDIVNVNGVVVKRNGNKADLKSLDPGIYVVNGKKVMVK